MRFVEAGRNTPDLLVGLALKHITPRTTQKRCRVSQNKRSSRCHESLPARCIAAALDTKPSYGIIGMAAVHSQQPPRACLTLRCRWQPAMGAAGMSACRCTAGFSQGQELRIRCERSQQAPTSLRKSTRVASRQPPAPPGRSRSPASAAQCTQSCAAGDPPT